MSSNSPVNTEGHLPESADHVENAQLPANRTYTGSVKDRCMDGYGTLVSPQDSYSGNFMENMRHGHGVFQSTIDVHPSGIKKYDGEWVMDEPNGNGTMVWCTGNSYTGPFYRGKPHGASGQYTFADGRVYIGEHKHGVRHGFGRLTQKNGEYYEGEFVEGSMSGQGTGWYMGGKRVYVGLWTKGRKVHGRMTFEGSDRMYNGDWLYEKPHGKGEMIFENNDHYVGEFVAGRLQGTGRITYHSLGGKVYSGTFLKDHPHGMGTITMPGSSSSSSNAVEVCFRQGRQLDKGDVRGMMEVMRELEVALSSTAVSEKMQAGLDPDSESACSIASRGKSTQPPISRDLSFEDVSAGGGIDGSGGNARGTVIIHNGSSHADDKTSSINCGMRTHNALTNDVSMPSTTSASASLLPGSEPVLARVETRAVHLVRETELMLPTLPSVNPRYSLDDMKGSSSCLSRGEEAMMLEASASVVAGTVTDGCKGWMDKFSIGRSHIGRSNWRRRYFVLAPFNTVVGLSYYKDELCRKPVAFIRLDTNDTRIVTRPSLRTHKEATKPGRDICVVYIENGREYKLLLRTDSEEEHDYWVGAFRKPFDIVDYPSDFPLLTSSQI